MYLHGKNVWAYGLGYGPFSLTRDTSMIMPVYTYVYLYGHGYIDVYIDVFTYLSTCLSMHSLTYQSICISIFLPVYVPICIHSSTVFPYIINIRYLQQYMYRCMYFCVCMYTQMYKVYISKGHTALLALGGAWSLIPSRAASRRRISIHACLEVLLQVHCSGSFLNLLQQKVSGSFFSKDKTACSLFHGFIYCFYWRCLLKVYKVWRQAVWLRLYGHTSCKRTYLWSNSAIIRELDLGKITKDLAESSSPEPVFRLA